MHTGLCNLQGRLTTELLNQVKYNSRGLAEVCLNDRQCSYPPLTENRITSFYFLFPSVINAMIDPDGTLEALNNMGFPNAILPSPPKQKSSPVNNHSSPGQTPALCPPETRALHPAAAAASAEFENAETEADFSIHFNRFNPDGEEEDVTVHE